MSFLQVLYRCSMAPTLSSDLNPNLVSPSGILTGRNSVPDSSFLENEYVWRMSSRPLSPDSPVHQAVPPIEAATVDEVDTFFEVLFAGEENNRVAHWWVWCSSRWAPSLCKRHSPGVFWSANSLQEILQMVVVRGSVS